MTYKTTGMIKLKPKESAEIVEGFESVTVGDDPVRREHIVNATKVLGTRILDPKKFYFKRNLAVLEHHSGEYTALSLAETTKLPKNYKDTKKLLKAIFVPYNFELRGVLDLSQTYFQDDQVKSTFGPYLKTFVNDDDYTSDPWDALTRAVLPIDVDEGVENLPRNSLCHLAPHDIYDSDKKEWLSVKGSGHWTYAFDECHTKRFGNYQSSYYK
jgi:hypothetical protein